MNSNKFQDFIVKHQLPKSYIDTIQNWFAPVAQEIDVHQKDAGIPLVIGINGAQGSGKSTLADLLVFLLTTQHSLSAVAMSIDDFYYTRDQRSQLANTVHPLIATRGVPGTHDVKLVEKTIHSLSHFRGAVALPKFNKAIDDRLAESEWPVITKPVDVIVLEGWCLGAQAQTEAELQQPVNDLEQDEDPQAIWRGYVNQQLSDNYSNLFELIDTWIMLKAPSFDCVFNWRLEQENKLRVSLSQNLATTQQDIDKIMDDKAVGRFIKFYQRITQHLLTTLPNKVNYLFELDENRVIQSLNYPQQFKTTDVVIFTDMDGSLLDHYDYNHQAADLLLKQLDDNNIPVIPNTSKTFAELLVIRKSLNNQHPFIAENGAAVFIPVGYFTEQPIDTMQSGEFWLKEFVKDRKYWQSLLADLPDKFNSCYNSFAQSSIDDIMAMTGLNRESAICSSQRAYGEPVTWSGSEEDKLEFISLLNKRGATILQGGRFMHISGRCDKGRALQWLLELYQHNSKKTVTSIAIGDSQNDIQMLEQADIALLIRSPVHPLPTLERDNNLYISNNTGPAGWNEGVNTILGAMKHQSV
jgi:D-glycerate 3-kinase